MKNFIRETKKLWLDEILNDTMWLLHLYVPIVLGTGLVIAGVIVGSILFGSR